MNPNYNENTKYTYYNQNQLQFAKDFFPTGNGTYTSLDPRLIDPMRGFRMDLNVPVYDTTERSFQRYDQNLKNIQTQTYPSYSDIHGGQISYYNDTTFDQVYFSPIFQLRSEVKPEIFIDPMGSMKPQYIRRPITNSKYISDYSSDQDEISFREDIMSLQMRIQDQEDYSKYMSSNNFTLASNSSQNYCK
jgi:hypothetical protein